MRIAILSVLLFPGLAAAAEVASPLALGCAELATHQGIRLHARAGEGDAAERAMRQALAAGSCRRVPDKERVRIVG